VFVQIIWTRPEPRRPPGRYRAAVSAVRRLVAGIAVLLAAAGCAHAAPATGTIPVPVATSATPDAPPGPDGPRLGTSARPDNGQVEATVFSFRPPPGGTGWAAADVQVCAVPNAIFDVTVSQGPWLLLLSPGPGTPASTAPDGTLPQPRYPTGYRHLHPGDCLRGWLGFSVPSGSRAIAVQYAPSGADPISWPVAVG
jgi:hypothetical protein